MPTNPTDDDLRRADRIRLIDPKRDWRMTLHTRIWNKAGTEIDIEVDSDDAQAVNAIVERVRALQPPLW